MTFEESFKSEHLYLTERECRTCGVTKNLIEGFYKIRKNTYNLSSYSYECKECSIKRTIKKRKEKKLKLSAIEEVYPDW